MDKQIKLKFFNPIKLYTKQNVKNISLKNLTWPQAEIRFSQMKPFGDIDKDGKLNMFDCRPFDRRRHSALSRDEIANRLFLKRKNAEGAYKRVSELTKKTIIPKQERDLRKYILKYVQENDISPQINYRTSEGKSMVEGLAKTYDKLITPKDIIKHIEKHPQLLKTAEKVYIRGVNPALLKGIDASTSIKGDEIAIISSATKKLDVGELLEHELAHVEQGRKLRNKLRGSTQKAQNEWMKKRGTIPVEEYNEYPIEKDAEERRKAKREEWKSWKKEQPETLQSLDDNESIEIKEED
jgi:hypothetical protein